MNVEGHAPPVETARAALRTAREVRARHLVALAEGRLTPLEFIQIAATDAGKPLRQVKLRQVHLSLPRWGEARTTSLMGRLASHLSVSPVDVATRKVSWLIDPRSGGSRFLAWLDAQAEECDGEPWSGFPFAGAGSRPTVDRGAGYGAGAGGGNRR